jgi:predicted O-methyltransferase YrrM
LPRVQAEVEQIKGEPTLDQFVGALWNYRGASVYQDIAPMQLQGEFLKALSILRQLRPERVVEIGTATGGSLFAFARVCADDALLVSIDLPGKHLGYGYPVPRSALYEGFTFGSQRIDLLRGDSHSEAMRDRVVTILEGQPVDLLFIDADHSYEGVARDYELYSPLVAPDGVVMFHDVNEHPVYGVSRFWSEVRKAHEAAGGSVIEIVELPHRPGMGLGLLLPEGSDWLE